MPNPVIPVPMPLSGQRELFLSSYLGFQVSSFSPSTDEKLEQQLQVPTKWPEHKSALQ